MNLITLDARKEEVLRSVVAHYANTGEPVSSRTASRITGLGLSAATIRNIMADLEDEGYICQTHISSGRLPTDKGYRYFVDYLMSCAKLSPAEQRSISEEYEAGSSEIEDVLRQTSELLSTFTRHTGIVSICDLSGTLCKHIDFIHVSGRRMLAVIVTENGMVTNKVVVLDEAISQEQLDKLSRFVNDRFRGLSLAQIREQVMSQMEDERRRFDKLQDLALMVSEKVFDGEAEAEVFVGAKQNILELASPSDIERLRALFMALEEKKRLVTILNECLAGGTKIFIGKEFDLDELSDYSLVARPYGTGERALGTVGIIGPTRMQYAKLIAIVDFTAKIINRLLSRK
ncbi:heat-inducible transcription repressor HrcA [bacterium]|nr:heat-inducible transcription repressor HrcA [bacterium]